MEIFDNKTSKYFFLFVCLNIIVFTIIFITNIEIYEKITNEDSLIEYFSFGALLFAGILFLLASFKSFKIGNDLLKNIILLCVGIIFILGAGEEISWGQRIFNFGTPDDLIKINYQDEFNLHNIDKIFFDRLVDRFTILLVIIGAFFILKGKTRFLKIKLPDIFILYALAITPFYHQYNSLYPDFYHLTYLPILVLLIWSIIKKNKNILFSSIATITISLLLMIFHVKFNDLFPDSNNSANEVREYLFSLACLFYAFFVYEDVWKSEDGRVKTGNRSPKSEV